jgi:hypothetical protein
VWADLYILYLFLMKIIKSLFFLMSLTLLSCSKDPEFPKPDYRDKFVGTYEMTFEMYSSNSYLLMTTKRYAGVSVQRTTVRKAVLSDRKWFREGSPPETYGLVVEGVPYLSTGHGALYQSNWYRIVHSTGDGSNAGYNILIFKGDSLYIRDYFGSCYAKYFSCETDGRGKKIR